MPNLKKIVIKNKHAGTFKTAPSKGKKIPR